MCIRDRLPIEQRVDFKVGVITYRCMHGTALEYLSDMFTSVTDDPGRRHHRSAVGGDVVPRTNTKTLGQHSFAVRGPIIQKGLPTAIRDMDSKLFPPKTEDILLPQGLST